MEYELYHHGILGMKWGIRRYQNKDGTLTEAGKKRYSRSNLTDADIKELKKYADEDDSDLGYGIYKNLLSEAKRDERSEVSSSFREAVSVMSDLNKNDSEFWQNDALIRKTLKEYNDSHESKYSYDQLSYASPASDLLNFYREKYAPEYLEKEKRLWELRDKYRNSVDKYFEDILGAEYNKLSKGNIYKKYYKKTSSLIAAIASDHYWDEVFDNIF